METNTQPTPEQRTAQPDVSTSDLFGYLTGGCLMARGGRVLRGGEVIGEHDYVVYGGLVNPASPVPPEWVGRRIFDGMPKPAVIRLPNNEARHAHE